MYKGIRAVSALIAGILGFAAATAPSWGADNVAHLDLSRHEGGDAVQIRQVGPRDYEWSLPDGLTQSLYLDLNAMGIDPRTYDELRFDLKPEGSLVFVQAVIKGMPGDEDVSSWYSKFRTQVGEWTEGRFDLRVDDDGVYLFSFYPDLQQIPNGRLTLTLSRQELGLPGEPSWRKARIRNPRLVRYPVYASFNLVECEMETEGPEVVYTYPLHLKNRTDSAQVVVIEPDSARSLKFFQVDAKKELTLAPGEARTVPIRLFMSRPQAMRLPALYAEPLLPRISVKGVADSDQVPLMGYRRWPMWGVVPNFNRVAWTPAAMQAFLDARESALPGIVEWRKRTIAIADQAMGYDWPMPENMLPMHPSIYRCLDAECRAQLQPVDPMKFHQHVCPKCKKSYENNEDLDRAGLFYYYSRRNTAVRNCAMAWLLTGDDAYAAKAVELLLSLAEAYPAMPVAGERSTSGATKFGASSLMSSYDLPKLAEAWLFLAEYRGLDEEQRLRIEATLNEEGLRIARHGILYSNMQAEHFRAYGSTAIATGFWPLAGEAIQGEFGWHEMVERAFTEDGIAHEAGAYHRAIFHAMDLLGTLALTQNVNLYTARFKRVFDGSITAGGEMLASPYETAYAVWREPTYLAYLQEQRSKGLNEQTIFHGILGLASASEMPVATEHMAGAGYIFLRKGNAADSYEIRTSYIKYFDRTEYDRFSTFFFRNGQGIETMPGRMSYGDVNASFMYATAAHNAIVVDGGDQREAHGSLVALVPDPETPIAVIATVPGAELYAGVQQLRAIALIENNYIVFDAIRSNEPHIIDRYQYGRGQAKVSCQLSPVPADFPAVPHPEYAPIGKLEAGDCGRQVVLGYKDDLTMTLVADRDFQLVRGLTHGGYQGQPMEVTFARADKTTEVAFLAAFTWGKDPAPPALVIRKNTVEEILLDVKIAERNYIIHIEPAKKAASVTQGPPQ